MPFSHIRLVLPHHPPLSVVLQDAVPSSWSTPSISPLPCPFYSPIFTPLSVPLIYPFQEADLAYLFLPLSRSYQRPSKTSKPSPLRPHLNIQDGTAWNTVPHPPCGGHAPSRTTSHSIPPSALPPQILSFFNVLARPLFTATLSSAYNRTVENSLFVPLLKAAITASFPFDLSRTTLPLNYN